MVKPGWQSKLVFFSSAAALLTSWSVLAAPLTVREITFQDEKTVQVQFDAPVAKRNIEVQFVRDIIQFTVRNATIYPAKIIHSDSSRQVGFSKLFAYQYSPSLIRIRLTVDGDASQYRKKFRWFEKGKVLYIQVPPLQTRALSESKEKSLLAKVLNSTQESEPLGKKPKLQSEAPVPSETLGGANRGPTAFRSFLAMFLVVGGLGLILVYVKQKKGSAQAKRVGDSWLSGLLGGTKGKKPLIEILSTHPLGAKQSITVVRIRDQQFVLGVTPDSVQLITQLDSDDLNTDFLDDPKVADSIGKIFGAKPTAPPQASFQSLLKTSQAQDSAPAIAQAAAPTSAPGLSTRDRIRQHLQGARS